MRTLFVDTAYWIALLNPQDNLHTRARSLSTSLGAVRMVTSEMVLAELLNDFGSRGAALRRAASSLVTQIYRDEELVLTPQTSSLFREALDLYAAREDKVWSLTDCASFRIMESLGIHEALAHDRHFEQAGFRALLRGGQES